MEPGVRFGDLRESSDPVAGELPGIAEAAKSNSGPELPNSSNWRDHCSTSKPE